MINKILVTGNLGQLGSYLSENLMEKNYEVIGLDNKTNNCSILPDKLDKISQIGDIKDKKSVIKAIKNVDAVVHCAAQVSVEKSMIDPINDLENNVLGTLNLLKCAVDSNSIKRFVYISTAAVYGNPIKLPITEDHPKNPISGYGLSKLTAERYVNMFWQIYKLPTVIIRPFNFYSERADPKSPYSGVITKFISRVKENQPPIIEGDGNQTRDFIHALDVVQMIVLTLEKEKSIGETFNCGSGNQTSINNLAKIIINASKKSLKPMYTKDRVGDIKYSYTDIKKAQDLLGFNPKIKLEDGMIDLIK